MNKRRAHLVHAGPRGRRIIARDHAAMSPSLTRDSPFVFARGKGVYIWDADGKRYLDFASSIAVMNAGYSQPSVMAAVRRQLSKGTHCAFPDFYAEIPVTYAETLRKQLPAPLSRGRVFLSNSGTEAVECALKLAKWKTRRPAVIAFDHCFHGRTMGSLSMTNSKPVQREGFGPFLPVTHVPYPYAYHMHTDPETASERCLKKLETTMRRMKGKYAAVFLEPVQGEGGYIVPPKSFVTGVRRLCTKYGILLVDDEVQAGCWRTGKFLAIEHYGVTPDIVVMAKAIGGGLPLGATVARPGLMAWPHGAHSNTFGGNLLASAAGIATLEFMQRKRLGQNAHARGNEIMQRMRAFEDRCPAIGEVRGRGLMIGVEIVKDKKTREPDPKTRDDAVMNAYRRGLVLLPAGKSVIRICPPLSITKDQAQRGVDILEKAIIEACR